MGFGNRTQTNYAQRMKDFFLANTRFREIATGVFIYIALSIILVANFVSQQVSLKIGQPSPKDIEAPRTVEYIDEKATNERRESAASKVNARYAYNEVTVDVAKEKIENTFALFRKSRNQADKTELQKLNDLGKQLEQASGKQIPEDVILICLRTSNEKLNQMEVTSKQVLETMMKQRISRENIDIARKQVDDLIVDLNLASKHNISEIRVIAQIVKDNLLSNLAYDELATKRLKEEAKASVQPVKRKIFRGQSIIRRGDTVTAKNLADLKALGLLKSTIDYNKIIGVGIFVFLLLSLIVFYIYRYRKDILHNEALMILLGIIMIIFTLTGRVLALKTSIAGYVVPISAGAMLVAVLLDIRLAILINAVMSMMIGIILEGEFKFIGIALIGGTIAIYSVSKVSQRSDLTRAGLIISGVNALTILSFGLLEGNDYLTVLENMGWGVLNGVLSSVLTIGFLPFLENIFGIITSVRLLELSNPNHPLLRRLLLEAPGTYHHCIIVGNMVETAAESVGADPLLARAGAYYHDIGKVKRPYFFAENQMMIDNPHDKLSPSLSTLIIISHIKDGAELAREYKIPTPLINIIEQHHGTTLVSYFYHRAVENDKNDSLSEENFRYVGPRPQTKEAALVMLADTVEATARSMSKPTPGRIEGLVRKIIKERLNEGQLDECDLTLNDLDKIAQAFVRVLAGIFHNRVEYPESVLKEMEGRKQQDGNSNRQQTNNNTVEK